MEIIMLLQAQHKPVPDNIEIVELFGSETIRDSNGAMHRGESAYLKGEPKAFKEWLRPFDGFWLTDNPLVGNWRIEHVKEENL